MQRGLVADGNGIVAYYVTFNNVSFLDGVSSRVFVKVDT